MSKTFIGRLKSDLDVIFFSDSEDGMKEVSKLFQFPEIGKKRVFQMDYELDSDEWFFVVLSEKEQEGMIDGYLSVVSSSSDYNKVTPKQYGLLRALYLVREGENESRDIIFNRIFDRFCIESKTFFKLDLKGPEIRSETNLIEFNCSVDAFWSDKENRLYFKKYSTIKPLFPGIERYYRSATEDEVTDFLKNEFFLVSEEFPSAKLGERALHNIAAILDSNEIDFSNPVVRKSYVEYSNSFPGFNVSVEGGRFKVERAGDLTKILSILQERLYVSPVTKQKRVASSTLPIT